MFEFPANSQSIEMACNETAVSKKFLEYEEKLAKRLEEIAYDDDSVIVYNPLDYAIETHTDFVQKYVNCTPKKLLFLGMNPG